MDWLLFGTVQNYHQPGPPHQQAGTGRPAAVQSHAWSPLDFEPATSFRKNYLPSIQSPIHKHGGWIMNAKFPITGPNIAVRRAAGRRERYSESAAWTTAGVDWLALAIAWSSQRGPTFYSPTTNPIYQSLGLTALTHQIQWDLNLNKNLRISVSLYMTPVCIAGA